MRIWQGIGLFLLLCVGAMAFAEPAAPGAPPAEKPAHAQPTLVQLKGTVKDLVTPKQLQGSVRFTLTAPTGDLTVLLGPQAYLDRIGLKVAAGAEVSLNGFQLEVQGKPVVMTRDITVDGKTYQIRSEKNNPLWGQFEGLPVVTVEGTIIEVIVGSPKHDAPAPAAGANPPAAAPAKPEKPKPQPVSVKLQTAKGEVTIAVGSDLGLQALGVDLQKDAKISITGWQGEAKDKHAGVITAKSIVIGDKTIVLRDDNGKPAWEKKPEGQPKHEGARHAK